MHQCVSIAPPPLCVAAAVGSASRGSHSSAAAGPVTPSRLFHLNPPPFRTSSCPSEHQGTEAARALAVTAGGSTDVDAAAVEDVASLGVFHIDTADAAELADYNARFPWDHPAAPVGRSAGPVLAALGPGDTGLPMIIFPMEALKCGPRIEVKQVREFRRDMFHCHTVAGCGAGVCG